MVAHRWVGCSYVRGDVVSYSSTSGQEGEMGR
jgi:hypothetical protein